MSTSKKKAKRKRKRKPKPRLNTRPVPVEPIYPWEQQPKETAKAFAAFSIYLEMLPEERTMRHVKIVINKHWSQISRWSSRHQWVKRVQAFDRHNERTRRIQLDRSIVKMHERQANHAVLGQMAAMGTLQKYVKTEHNPDPPMLRERDAIRLFDVASRVEWRARGEPDTVTESKGKIEVSTPASADETRASMVRLLEDPEAVEHMAAISKLLGTDGSNGKG